jgi:hypothetical protein
LILARADMDASGKSVEQLGRALMVRERLETKKQIRESQWLQEGGVGA